MANQFKVELTKVSNDSILSYMDQINPDLRSLFVESKSVLKQMYPIVFEPKKIDYSNVEVNVGPAFRCSDEPFKRSIMESVDIDKEGQIVNIEFLALFFASICNRSDGTQRPEKELLHFTISVGQYDMTPNDGSVVHTSFRVDAICIFKYIIE
jgi:hypothetical protein